uniref:Cyclic GMP-AMP synthase n=1 Tax=Pelusios castaneus TaxID=367368 RepID=A0A8C8VIA8_9SAUR
MLPACLLRQTRSGAQGGLSRLSPPAPAVEPGACAGWDGGAVRRCPAPALPARGGAAPPAGAVQCSRHTASAAGRPSSPEAGHFVSPGWRAPGESDAVLREKGAAPTGKDPAPREKGAVCKPKETAEPLPLASYSCLGADSCIGARWLRDVLKTLSLGRADTSEASGLVNQLINTLVPVIKAQESTFSSIESLGTGSYYEHVKISAPNEFDIMLTMPAPRVKLEPCEQGSGAFFYARLKRNPKRYYLNKYLSEDKTLEACKMLSALRKIIKEFVKNTSVTVDKKKVGSPAITLRIGTLQQEISVDIILALEVRSQSWPASTQGGLNIKKWLGAKVKQEYKWKPLYLVPKHAKDGRMLKEDTWRLSFSHIEKDMIKNHGNTKTCCESEGRKCCRKDCLKLLKHLLDQLKTKHGNKRGLDKFCSYHAKTAFFQACVLWPDDKEWLFTDLESCFQKFLDYFLDCLNKVYLPHFFIPTYNLFGLIDKASSEFLSKEIKYEINNRFPIFKLQN